MTIRIVDVNDNPPRFTHDIYNFRAFEYYGSGTQLGIVRATDSDSGINGVITYRFVSGNDEGKIYISLYL